MLIAVCVAELVLTGCPEVLEGVGQVSTGGTTSSQTNADADTSPSSPGSGEDGVPLTSGGADAATTSTPVTSAAEDETGGSTETGTSGSSSGSTTDTTGAAEPDPCQECVEQACPDEYTACQMAPGCSCYVECYSEVADEETCADACGIDGQPAEVDPLVACFFDSDCGPACS